ncbi:MAG: hypothetical protein KC416_11960, partial [Myxococcales bacterium]|nr:hypothetical protein [Myxococcales bacterium]
MSHTDRPWSVPTAILLMGCLGTPNTTIHENGGAPADGAVQGPHELGWTLLDGWGEEHTFGRSPLRPTVVLHLSASPKETVPMFLFEGFADDGLIDDLSATPLRKASEARRIAATTEVRGRDVALTPLGPLTRGQSYTVCMAGGAKTTDEQSFAQSVIQEVTVGTAEDAGVGTVDLWPPDGATGLPTNLDEVFVRFDGRLSTRAPLAESPFWIASDDSHLTDGAQRVVCEDIGWNGGECFRLPLQQEASPLRTYRLRQGAMLLDSTGAEITLPPSSFSTGQAQDTMAPTATTLACALDERSIHGLCVLEDDESISVRVRFLKPVRLFWFIGDLVVARSIAPRGEALLDLESLPPETTFEGEIQAVDAAGNRASIPLRVGTTPRLSQVSIAEFLTDPTGP